MKRKLTIFFTVFCMATFSGIAQNKNSGEGNPLNKRGEYDFLKRMHIMNDTVSMSNKTALLSQAAEIEFSGWIYFTGSNFPDAQSMQYKGRGLEMLEPYFSKCTTGSRITFEKCKVKKPDGSSSVLNKHIVFK